MITRYEDLSISKYTQLQEIATDKGYDDVERNTAILSVLTDMSERELLNLPIGEYQQMSDNAHFLLQAFHPAPMRARTYRLGEWVLTCQADIDSMTAGQYIDFQTFQQDDAHPMHMARLLSVLMIPEGKRYNDGYDVRALQEDIYTHMPITDAVALVNFWLAKWQRSMLCSLSYLALRGRMNRTERKVARILRKRLRAAFRRNGDGCALWIWSARP